MQRHQSSEGGSCSSQHRSSCAGAEVVDATGWKASRAGSRCIAVGRVGNDSRSEDRFLVSGAAEGCREGKKEVSGGSSTSTGCRPPLLRNVVRARSTSETTFVGSGATVSVPASMLPASSRFAIRPRMWLACPLMRWKSSSISAREAAGAASSTVPAEPLIDTSGARSSWPTILRNFAHCRSSSSARIGAVPSIRRAGGRSASETSCPSDRRHVSTPSSCSGGEPGVGVSSTMRCASRLTDATRQLPASNTTTHTGEVSTSAARSARARGGRLQGEEHHDLLALGCERRAVRLVANEEVADVLAPVAPRSALQRVCGPRARRKAARLHQVAGETGQLERLLDLAQVHEEPRPVGPCLQLTDLLGGQAGGQEVRQPAARVDPRDHALAGAGQRTSAVDHLLERSVQIQARVDPENRAAQPRETVPKRPVLPPQFAQVMQCFSPRFSLVTGKIRTIFPAIHGINTKIAQLYM